MKWKTKDGQVLDVSKMTTQHIINCIAFCKKRNQEGVEVMGGHDIEDIYYDIDHNFFDGDIEGFKKELSKRGVMNEPHERLLKSNPWKDIPESLNDLIDKVILEFHPQLLDDDIPDALDDWDNRVEAIDYLIDKLQKMKED